MENKMNMDQALAKLDASNERLYARPVSVKGTGFAYFSVDGHLHFRPGTLVLPTESGDAIIQKIVPSIKEMLGQWEVVKDLENVNHASS